MIHHRVPRVLVVCKGNTCRSPMLAELLRLGIESRNAGPDMPVESAGILPEAAGKPAASEWAELQSETNIDLSRHRSRFIGSIGDLSRFDFVVCAEPSVVTTVKEFGVPNEKIVLAGAPDGMPNPYQQGIEAYRQCFHTTLELVQGGLLDRLTRVEPATA